MNRNLNKELIYNTKCLFTEYLDGEDNQKLFYNIPEYQRGYKWTTENIIQLLDDIQHFHRSDDTFYCLQNITIIPATIDGHSCFNVIDGQQRLTTLFILLSYLQKDNEKHFFSDNSKILQYSIRKSTDKYLNEYVLSGKIWTKDIDANDSKTKDEFYIREACATIDNWFKKRGEDRYQDLVEEFKDKVLNYVVLIVNKLDNSSNEENVFANLNGGKVDLDGADLLRAILITKAAREKYPISEENYQFNTPFVSISIKEGSSNRVNEYRIRLGMEIDNVSAWWGQKDVRTFFTQILPNEATNNKSFQCNKYPIDLLYLAYFEAYKSYMVKDSGLKKTNIGNVDIRFFENGIDFNHKEGDDHYELYTSILKMHRALKEWYQDDAIYNLLGFLFFNFKGTNGITFSDAWRLWSESNTKEKFKEMLKKRIRMLLLSPYVVTSNDENDHSDPEGIFKNNIENIHHNWFEEPNLLKILVLLDIIPSDTLSMPKRLHVDFFKANDEDKEHIRPQTENQQSTTVTEDYEACLNSIGNLVLLDSGINRSYKNALYKDKVQRIVNAYFREHKYIRPHTFLVFLTKLNDNDTMESEWTDREIQETANKVYEEIAKFLCFKENANKEVL